MAEYGLKLYLGFPILVEEEVVGSLCVVDTEKRTFTEVEIYFIEAFASAIRLEEERLLPQTRLASANETLKIKNEAIETLALTDQLTGLPNRRAIIQNIKDTLAILHRRLFRAEKAQGLKGFSLALCDIDHFKVINDTYGHNRGDEVLKAVAKKLSSLLRAKDAVARWGGEEFLIIFPETDMTTTVAIAERLRKAISEIPFSHNGQTFRVTLTLGVTTCDTADMDLDACVHFADMALYAGKEKGRNCVMSTID